MKESPSYVKCCIYVLFGKIKDTNKNSRENCRAFFRCDIYKAINIVFLLLFVMCVCVCESVSACACAWNLA